MRGITCQNATIDTSRVRCAALDPRLPAPKLRVARKLLARKLGFRNLLDVTPLDATLVKGSHGVPAATREGRPVFIGDRAIVDRDEYDAVDVHGLILRHLTR